MDDGAYPGNGTDPDEGRRIVARAVAAARAAGTAVPDEVAGLTLDELLDRAERRALEAAVAEARESGPGIPHEEVERWMRSRLDALMVQVVKRAAAK